MKIYLVHDEKPTLVQLGRIVTNSLEAMNLTLTVNPRYKKPDFPFEPLGRTNVGGRDYDIALAEEDRLASEPMYQLTLAFNQHQMSWSEKRQSYYFRGKVIDPDRRILISPQRVFDLRTATLPAEIEFLTNLAKQIKEKDKTLKMIARYYSTPDPSTLFRSCGINIELV